jgi:hypothetical protein
MMNTANWIADAIIRLRREDAVVMEAAEAAEDAWTEQITAIAEHPWSPPAKTCTVDRLNLRRSQAAVINLFWRC